MPVLMNHSSNSKPLNNIHLNNSFSPPIHEQSEESKHIEDYNRKLPSNMSKRSGSPQRAYNLDLI